MEPALKSSNEARERILEVAGDLFYRQGYRATGINEVIRKAGVAKATFYAHFPSKDDLCLESLRQRNAAEIEEIKAYVATRVGPGDRYLGVIEAIEAWLRVNDIRGCGFLNMVSEVPDPDSPLRREGVDHYDAFRGLVLEVCRDLIASDPDRYGHLQVFSLADHYLLIATGAIALAEIYHDISPVVHAREQVAAMIE